MFHLAEPWPVPLSLDKWILLYHSTECTEEGSIRLVGGSTAEEGRVHICYNGIWSTVCNTTFDAADAMVVCRQLGHNATSMLRLYH